MHLRYHLGMQVQVETERQVLEPVTQLDWMTVDEYAAVTERRPNSVRRSIARGHLRAVKAGRDWLIPVTELPSEE